MLYFPQLASGAIGQHPITRNLYQRTVTNVMPDGSRIRYADPGAPYVEWTLRYQSLSDTEAGMLDQFFGTCEGRLQPFTFADPLANLLMWSEDLTQPAWEASALLQLATGVADPNGGLRAIQIKNPTSADLGIQQAVAVPGWYWYTFSVHLQSQTGISLFRQAGGLTSEKSYCTSNSWQRVSLTGQSNTTAAEVTVGITIRAGQTVTVYGFQLEPQTAASTYKPSYETGGAYTNAHFSNDTFVITTTAPNRNQCALGITAR